MTRSPAPLALLLAAVATGQAFATQVPGSSIHVTHYDLAIRPDFAARRLKVVASVTVENPALADSFDFALSARYSQVLVVRADSSPADVERGPGRVTIHVHAPQAREIFVFTLEGEPGRSLDEDCDVIAPQSLFLLWSDRFYPLRFEDWATARTTVVLPAGFQAVAPGRLVGREPDGADVRWVFETTQPSRLLSVFADTRWIRTERVINGIRMLTLLHPESQRFSGQILASSADVLDFYRSLLGPYRFDGFSFITLEGIYARRAFDGFVGYSPEYLARELSTTDQDVPYTGLRGSTPQDIVHGKYPWLMQVMRYVVGDPAFRRGVHLVFDRYRFRTFSMDELVATLEEGTGQSLRWWRTEWLERPGVPELTLWWAAAPQGPRYRVTGTITQTGSLYHIPVEIAVETERGTTRARVQLAERETAFAVETAARPARVTLDPDHWLLARIVAP